MAEIEPALARHELVRVAPAAWPRMLAEQPDLPDLPLLRTWADQGWPLIARRAVCGDVKAQVALGLPLPPSCGKQRLTFTAQGADVVDHGPPPLLREAATAAPAAWRDCIDALLDAHPQTRCFGSLAWEYVTGLPYLAKTSDLDLLWPISSRAHADSLTRRINAIAATAPMSIDGELLAPSGQAVQWREWYCDAPELLAKHASGATLLTRAAFLP